MCYYVIRKFRQGIPTKLDCFPLQVFTFRDRCYPAAVFLFCIDNNINNNNDNDNNIDINNMIDNNNNINCQGVSGMEPKGFRLTVTVDAKAVSDELDKVASGLQKEFNELREEYADLKAEYEKVKAELSEANASFLNVDGKYREKADALIQIRGYIEDLAEYGFKDEIGHPLHMAMPFVKIADIVGAEIPKADVIHAKVKSSIVDDKPKKVEPFKVLSDKELFDGISNAKITEAAIHPPITDSDLKEKMVWVKELGVYILPKFV